MQCVRLVGPYQVIGLMQKTKCDNVADSCLFSKSELKFRSQYSQSPSGHVNVLVKFCRIRSVLALTTISSNRGIVLRRS